MTEYIEREAALALVRPDAPEDEKAAVTIATAKKLVRNIVLRTPAAAVAPVAHGRWIPVVHVGDCCYRCSECQFYGTRILLTLETIAPTVARRWTVKRIDIQRVLSLVQ